MEINLLLSWNSARCVLYEKHDISNLKGFLRSRPVLSSFCFIKSRLLQNGTRSVTPSSSTTVVSQPFTVSLRDKKEPSPLVSANRHYRPLPSWRTKGRENLNKYPRIYNLATAIWGCVLYIEPWNKIYKINPKSSEDPAILFWKKKKKNQKISIPLAFYFPVLIFI